MQNLLAGDTPVPQSLSLSHTGKIVQRPRPSIKGRAAAKKVQAIIDTGLVDTDFIANGLLPAGLSLEHISNAMQFYITNEVFTDWKWDMDLAIAFLTTIIINKNSKPLNEAKEIADNYELIWRKKGFCQVLNSQFKQWVHSDYKQIEHYRKAFENAGIIECHCHKHFKTSPEDISYAYRFKINPDFFIGPIKYRKEPYTSSRQILKVLTYKQKKLEEIHKKETRNFLIKMAHEMFHSIDMESLKNYLCSLPEEDKPSEEKSPSEIYRRVGSIMDGYRDFYINERDWFGGRLHTPWTNMPSYLKGFIKEADSFIELDLKNSQFQNFSALAINDPKMLTELLKTNPRDIKHKDKKEEKKRKEKEVAYNKNLPADIHTIQYFYQTYADVKEFVDHALTGELYIHTQKRLKEKGIVKTEKEVKDLFFPAFFSEEHECKREQNILAKVYLNMIRLSNILNKDKRNAFSMLLQRFESNMIIDKVCVALYAKQVSPFFSIHDSIVYPQHFTEIVEQTFVDIYTQMGFVVPAYRKKLIKRVKL